MNNNALSALCSSYGNGDCPCVLSILNECLVCSHLQGKEFCDCQWNKYCVFIDYLHGCHDFSVKPHEDFLVPVRHFDMGSCGHLVFMTAPRTVLKKARSLDPVLLKGRPPLHLEMPAVVLSTYPDCSLISLAIKPFAQNGTSLFTENDCFELCSTGFSAISPMSGLKRYSNKKVLIFAENFGILLLDRFIRNYFPLGNQLTIVMNRHLPFIQGKFRDRIKDCQVIQPLHQEALHEVLKENNFDACFSLGNHAQNVLVKQVISSQSPATPLFCWSLDSKNMDPYGKIPIS